MRVKLTLLRSDSSLDDIVVTTTATATVGEVATAIARSDPRAPFARPDSPFSLYAHRLGAAEAEFLMPSRPLSEVRLGSGVTVSVVELDAARDWTRERLPVAEAVLRVVDGRDAGARFVLDTESAWIGRLPDLEVTLTDPLVSKRHARVEIGPEGVIVVDNNSANGIEVDGGRVARVALGAGARFVIGGTQLEVESFRRTAPDRDDTGDAGVPVAFTRRPRVEVRFPGEELTPPEIPSRERIQPFPWLVMVAPLLVGGVLFAVTKSALSIVFVALSPILMLANWASQTLERRRSTKEAVAQFESEFAELAERVGQHAAVERAVRLAEAPSLADVVDHVRRRDALLWARRPRQWSFLAVRLGLGTARSRSRILERSAPQRALPGFARRVDQLRDAASRIADVPIIESLSVAGGLGVAGTPSAAHWYARGLLTQIAALHSPAEVVLCALTEGAHQPELGWMRWLPHPTSPQSPLDVPPLTDSPASAQRLLSALEGLVADRLAAAGSSLPEPEALAEESWVEAIAGRAGTSDDDVPPHDLGPTLLVVVAGNPPVDTGRLTQLFERGESVGVHPVWIADRVADLPAICRTFVDIPATPGVPITAGFAREGRLVPLASVEGLSVEEADDVARALAPVVDVGAVVADDSDLPRTVSLLSILGPEFGSDPAAIVERWRQNESILERGKPAVERRSSGSLRAIVGMAGADAMTLDLRTQGPHALVGGTTGSGKSEFLQAWVLGMAAEYSPDRLTFLFVDYKGGSAFAECVDLPHCVGIVTDLTTHLVRRALTSLRAEIHRREHLFNEKKAKDLADLEKRGDTDAPPRLVIVIDEFAALATEIPEFVDGVVDIAQRGRSLGIHLIMATQRPAGVIKDNLRANTNLRVALRMADESDSTDVVGSSVAGGFDPGVPGRGIAKTGPGRLTPFQTGYAGGWTSEVRVAESVEVVPLTFGEGRPWELPADDAPADSTRGPNDTSRMVSSMTAAARAASIPPPRRPWLDELGGLYDLAELRQRSDDELVVGVVDDPQRQEQRTAYFRPDDDGSIAFFGTGGTGKSTALRTLATAAAITPRGGPVHVYAIDFTGGALRMLESLPHVGAVIAGDDEERILRLFSTLREVAADRVERYSAARASSIGEYRRLASAPDEPRILVLIDGMATFRQEYEYSGSGGVFAQFQQLLADGRGVGVHFALTADRPGSLSPAVAASVQRKVSLRLSDENDYLLIDAPSDVLGPTSVPGRAIIDGLEAQIAILGGSRTAVAQSDALAELAASMEARGAAPAPPVRQLPSDVRVDDLGTLPGLAAIGLADDTLGPVGIEPEGVIMISGPPVSGRSSALRLLRASCARALTSPRLVYFGTRRSPVAAEPGWDSVALDVDQAAAWARDLLAAASAPVGKKGALVVVIEGIADFLGTAADADLTALVKAARRNGHLVIAESESSTWTQSWPLLVEVKSARRGIALQPDVTEGELLFKTPFPRARRADFPPGRGWLVEAGRVRKVQLANPE